MPNESERSRQPGYAMMQQTKYRPTRCGAGAAALSLHTVFGGATTALHYLSPVFILAIAAAICRRAGQKRRLPAFAPRHYFTRARHARLRRADEMLHARRRYEGSASRADIARDWRPRRLGAATAFRFALTMPFLKHETKMFIITFAIVAQRRSLGSIVI